MMLENKVIKAENRIASFLDEKGLKPASFYHYGAIEIDPKYLVIHIIYQTVEEMQAAYAAEGIIEECFKILKKAGYPKGQKEGVHIGFEAIERINERANGNWYHYFK